MKYSIKTNGEVNNDWKQHLVATYEESGSTPSDVPFTFSYNASEDSFGYLDQNGNFVSFSSGGPDISDTTASAQTVLSGYYFYTSQGVRTQGSIVQRSASSQTITGSQTYSSGFYPSSWTVTSGGIDTSDATAVPSQLSLGATAYVKGQKITGTRQPLLTKYQETSISFSGAMQSAATHNTSYAMFGGGTGSSVTASIQAIDSSLTIKSASLRTSKYGLEATHIGQYALFGGGRSSSNTSLNSVDAYNASLTRSYAPNLSDNTAIKEGATHISDNYAILYTYGNSSGSNAYGFELYNSTLTKSNLYPGFTICDRATHIGNYALFSCSTSTTSGSGSSIKYSWSNTMRTLNSSLVWGTTTSLSVPRQSLAGTYVGNYAIFAGGSYKSGQYVSTYCNNVDAYNSSLSRSNPTYLSIVMHSGVSATHMFNYALFGGGRTTNNSGTNVVNSYNTSLTRTIPATLDQVRIEGDATCIDNWAFFGNGSIGASLASGLDVYCE